MNTTDIDNCTLSPQHQMEWDLLGKLELDARNAENRMRFFRAVKIQQIGRRAKKYDKFGNPLNWRETR